MEDLLKICYQKRDGRDHYYVWRNDEPRQVFHEITLGAILDLEKNIQRYQDDFMNELMVKPKK